MHKYNGLGSFELTSPFYVQLDFKLYRMSKTPANRQTILVKDIFSDKPVKPIPVVTIKTTGPTKASNELI